MRYVSKKPRRRRLYEDDWEDEDISVSHQTSSTVYDYEPDTFTGLYDANGDEIHFITRQPIGFDLDWENDD